MSQNLRNVALYASETMVSVQVLYNKNGGKPYTFVTSKEIAATLVEGDTVLVASKTGEFGCALAFVHRIDKFCDINPHADFDYLFLTQKIDMSEALAMEETLKQVADSLEQVRRKRYREEVVRSLGLSGEELTLLGVTPSTTTTVTPTTNETPEDSSEGDSNVG